MKKLLAFILTISFVFGLAPSFSILTFAIDDTLEFVTPCIWQYIGYQYSEELVEVQEQDFNGMKGKWGYMDRFGKLQIPVQWDNASSFSEGLAAVELNGMWGYIDTSGKIVIPLQFGYAHDFHEGIAVVQDIETKKKGYINNSGDIVVPLEYDNAFTFTDGFGKVMMDKKDDNPGFYRMFDKNGVINPLWDCIGGSYLNDYGYFTEGLAWATGPGGRGYINKAGNLMISVPEGWGSVFNSERAYIRSKNNGEGYYIDQNGTPVITENYCHYGDFYQGYAVVQEWTPYHTEGDEFIIDVDGNILGKFENGIAYNEEKKMIWIYDYKSDRAYSYKYQGDIADLNNIRFKLENSSENALIAYKLTEQHTILGMGVFDKDFNLIIPFEYQDIQALSDNYFMVSNNNDNSGPRALIDRNNNIISDFSSLRFTPPKEDRFVVYQPGKGYGIVRLHKDGELYQADPAEKIGTAQETNIFINNIAEKAYSTNGNIYINIETLQKYGILISSKNGGKDIQLTRQSSKNKLMVDDTFIIQDGYTVYSSNHKISINGNASDSLLIEQDICINIDVLHCLGIVSKDNEKINVYIDRPYMQNEGITWEWRTDLLETSKIQYAQGTYSLQGYGLGIKILSTNGQLLYQDDNATYCNFANGLWQVAHGYINDPKKTITYVNLNGEIVETPPVFTPCPPTSTPTPGMEYPQPLYKQKDYWDGSLHGNTRPVNISTGKYVDEAGNVVLENEDWIWTEPFINGTALVNVGGNYNPVGSIIEGKWGVINTSGNYIVEPIWDRIKREADGNIIATFNGKEGLVDGHGVSKIPFEYDRLYYYSNFNSRPDIYTELNRKKGLIDTENNILLPCMFDSIDKSGEKYYSVSTYYGNQYCTGITEPIEIPVLQGNILIHGKKTEFDTPPLLINDRTMIPVRTVFEKMGCLVEWDESSNTAVITLNDTCIKIKQDTNYIKKNGEYIYSDTASINYHDRIHVPLRVISEALGCDVNYDSETGNVTIDFQ